MNHGVGNRLSGRIDDLCSQLGGMGGGRQGGTCQPKRESKSVLIVHAAATLVSPHRISG